MSGAAPIAIYLSALTVGGRERLILEVARAIAARGQPVDLVTAGARPGWVDVPDGVSLINLVPWTAGILRRTNIARLILAIPALAAYLARHRPSTLLGISIPPNLTALIARRLSGADTRILLRQSNVVRVPHHATYARIRRRWRDPLIRRLYPAADGFIAVSRGVADNLRCLMADDSLSVRVIYNHVITDDFDARAAEAPNHPWLNDRASPCIVAVGRLVPKKDYRTLLGAFARLRRTRCARLLILGEGPERQSLTLVIRDLGLEGCVELVGHVENPLPYLIGCDAYVLSSISEGMPSALVEALACGCSIVSTDCPSGPAEILEDGRYGRLVPVGDVQAMTRAMDEALASPPAPALLKRRAAHFRAERGIEAYLDALLHRP